MKNKVFSGLVFVLGACFSFSAQSQKIVSLKSGIANWKDGNNNELKSHINEVFFNLNIIIGPVR